MKPKYTVAQLIEELKKFLSELLVITSGYEGEYENILPPNIINVKFVPNEPYYNGQFQQTIETDENSFEAVLISREFRPYNL